MFLKICSTAISTLAKSIGLLLIVALLTPLAYFAWRAGQPMDRSEFRGLTFYQLLSERQEAYTNLRSPISPTSRMWM